MGRRFFKIVPHTAEVAVELQGDDWPEFFETAAAALLELYDPDPLPSPAESRTLRLEGKDAEDLLVSFLNELIYLVGTKRWIPCETEVRSAGPDRVEAELRGGPLGAGRLVREIKAATFGGLRVEPLKSGGRRATVILDV